jgi:hypothetical protein
MNNLTEGNGVQTLGHVESQLLYFTGALELGFESHGISVPFRFLEMV